MPGSIGSRASNPAGRRRPSPRAAILLGTAFLIVFLGGALVGSILADSVSAETSSWDWRLILAIVTAFLFGSLVGLSEILTRYRDEPIRASFNLYGCAYLTFNGLVALGAFWLLRRYSNEIFPAVAGDLFLTAIAAGFGAMVVMRSKLFTYNSPDGNEFAVGPAIVIDTVLGTIDMKIDRLRAAERQERVYAQLRDVTDFESAAQYLEASLLSFQNLSEQQKSDVSSVVADYRDSAWDSRLKVMALGFAFLTIAGEDNFDQVVASMKRFVGLTE